MNLVSKENHVVRIDDTKVDTILRRPGEKLARENTPTRFTPQEPNHGEPRAQRQVRESFKCFARSLRNHLARFANHVQHLLHARADPRNPSLWTRRTLRAVFKPRGAARTLSQLPGGGREFASDLHLVFFKSFRCFAANCRRQQSWSQSWREQR